MLRDKVIEIFVKVDDFCKEIVPMMEEKRIEDKKLGRRNRKAGLSESEIISLLILFHSGQFSNLKSFYVYYAQPHLKDLFPGLPSYNRFVELQPRCAVLFMLRKRAIIECVNDELKNICELQHTRHRSVNNFLLNILGALAAYAFFPKKPSLNIKFEQNENQLFLAA